jgi:phage terminase small subunit
LDKNRRIRRQVSAAASGLKQKQAAALLALIETPTMTAAARRAGVSRSALFLWMKDATFKAKLDELRAEMFDEGLGLLKASMGRAARCLAALLDSRNENTRRLAAVSILGLGIKANETMEIEARIRKLETIVEDKRPRLRPN